MSQRKKILMSAEPERERRTEAVLKLSVEPTRDSDEGPIDKDGDDGGGIIDQFLIEIAENGFMLTITFMDGIEEKTVHEDFDFLLDFIRSRY